ncbi:MAG: adenylate kinase [Acidobacteriota bacterium]
MNVVLLGPPGAGKGTHGSALSRHLGLPHISTGDLLREAIAAGNSVGHRVESIVAEGRLVPDEIMAEMVRERFQAPDTSGGCILDGYPRTLEQARMLETILEELHRRLDRVLNLVVDDEEIVRRLSGRRVCEGCGALFHIDNAPPRRAGRCDTCGGELSRRTDDDPEVVRRRMKVYRKSTEPLVAFYRAQEILREIDAIGPVADVRERVLGAVA